MFVFRERRDVAARLCGARPRGCCSVRCQLRMQAGVKGAQFPGKIVFGEALALQIAFKQVQLHNIWYIDDVRSLCESGSEFYL